MQSLPGKNLRQLFFTSGLPTASSSRAKIAIQCKELMAEPQFEHLPKDPRRLGIGHMRKDPVMPLNWFLCGRVEILL